MSSSTPTTEIVFAGTDGGGLTELDDYEKVGGLQALRRARAMTPDEIGRASCRERVCNDV